MSRTSLLRPQAAFRDRYERGRCRKSRVFTAVRGSCRTTGRPVPSPPRIWCSLESCLSLKRVLLPYLSNLASTSDRKFRCQGVSVACVSAVRMLLLRCSVSNRTSTAPPGFEFEVPRILVRQPHASGGSLIVNPNGRDEPHHGDAIPAEQEREHPWMLAAKGEHRCCKGNVGYKKSNRNEEHRAQPLLVFSL